MQQEPRHSFCGKSGFQAKTDKERQRKSLYPCKENNPRGRDDNY